MPGQAVGVGGRCIVKCAREQRWPVVAGVGEFADAGALLVYSADVLANYRRAYYVDRILKGAKPADLPVEQPTKFEFVINLKTAKAARADDPAVRAGAGG